MGGTKAPWAVFEGPNGPLLGTKKTGPGGPGHLGPFRPPTLRPNWETFGALWGPEDGLGGTRDGPGRNSSPSGSFSRTKQGPLWSLKTNGGGPGPPGAASGPRLEAQLGSLVGLSWATKKGSNNIQFQVAPCDLKWGHLTPQRKFLGAPRKQPGMAPRRLHKGPRKAPEGPVGFLTTC